jgi:RNA polymerase sigma-70 factor (ECF subfamily)
LRAWKYFGTFEQGTNTKAWLFRILQNVLTDHWRRRRAEVRFDEEESGIEPYYDWEDDFLKDELSGTLEQALSRLPEKYRWALLLADVQELSYQEIASVMGCPVGTVMSRLNRARRTLARLLRPELETYGAS